MKIEQIKIDFNVTPEIKRFVYVYLLGTAEACYMVDSGVGGCEVEIENRMKSCGFAPENLKGIFLTHAHPDHIGSANYFRSRYGCKVYASDGEKRWIENIDVQFAERPIPNFYKLAGASTPVDVVVKDDDKIELCDGSALMVVATPGHSVDEVSYVLNDRAFIGDAIPVKGDIPILVNVPDTRATLKRIAALDCTSFCPAWDHIYDAAEIQTKIKEAEGLLNAIEAAVKQSVATKGTSAGASSAGANGESANSGCVDLATIVDEVCVQLSAPMLKMNPLFKTTVKAFVEC